MMKFFKHESEKILEEDYRCKDFLFFDKIIENFKKRLAQIKNNAIIGLVGKFGSGKSTMLYQLYKDKTDKDNEKWINFDAWKFPERKDLWEGFVLEFARKIDKKTFDKVRKIVDGHQNDDKNAFINAIGDIPIPGFAAIKNITHFFQTSPARRVFEIQEILKGVIKKLNKDIYIIVEDIDRSGDKGIFFLETLKNFIKENENEFSNKIVVIVPIGDKEFNSKDAKDAYNKILDYRFDFNADKINFSNFIDAIFDTGQLHSCDFFTEQLNYLFQSSASKYEFTIRDIKRILRLAGNVYEGLSQQETEKIDVRVWILFACMYDLKIKKDKITETVDERLKFREKFWGKNFLAMLANNTDKVLPVPHPFCIVDDDRLMTPRREPSAYYLSDKYFDYFK